MMVSQWRWVFWAWTRGEYDCGRVNLTALRFAYERMVGRALHGADLLAKLIG